MLGRRDAGLEELSQAANVPGTGQQGGRAEALRGRPAWHAASGRSRIRRPCPWPMRLLRRGSPASTSGESRPARRPSGGLVQLLARLLPFTAPTGTCKQEKRSPVRLDLTLHTSPIPPDVKGLAPTRPPGSPLAERMPGRGRRRRACARMAGRTTCRTRPPSATSFFACSAGAPLAHDFMNSSLLP